jgi:hypothetical protein
MLGRLRSVCRRRLVKVFNRHGISPNGVVEFAVNDGR